jgi:hypothetical protein
MSKTKKEIANKNISDNNINDKNSINENSDEKNLIDEEKLNEIHTELVESKGKNYKQLEKKFKKIFINILLAILIVLFFGITLLKKIKVSDIQFENFLKTSSVVCLVLSLILFENSYYKDNENLFLNAIEIAGLGICVLYLLNITIKQNISLNFCIIIMIAVFVSYYIVKSIIIRFKRENYEYDI